MYKIKDYKIEILMILLLVFVFTISYYQQIQSMLILESNRLLTGNAVSIQGNDTQMLELENLKNISYRIFVILHEDINNNSSVYAFYTPLPGSWLPPMSEGAFFEENNTQEAVVGRNVTVEETATGYVYFFDGQAYEVVGFLGLTTPSLLDDTVLINSGYNLSNTEHEIIVDYDRANVLVRYFGEEAIIQTRGVLRLLATDFFTPFIVIYSQIITILTVMVIGYLYFLKTQPENTIRYLIGENSIKIFGISVWKLLQKWLLFSILFFILIKIGLLQSTQVISQWMMLSLILIVSYAMIYFKNLKMRGNRL